MVTFMYGIDFARLERRYGEYWNRENHDTPLLSVYVSAPLAEPDMPKTPENIRERWLDVEAAVARARRHAENTYFGGDAYPMYNPNLGPDILGAICGCGIEFGEDTSWAVNCVEDWAAHPPIAFDENNFWFKKILEMTEAACAGSRGDYLVGVTDLHSGMDGLVSLRGPENLCLDIKDSPELVPPRLAEMHAVYMEVYSRLEAAILKAQRGTSCWMGVWHPSKRWYVTSDDFAALISHEDFERFVVPHVEAELDYLDASIFHLDGPDALRHLDRLLAMPKLCGIQWVYGAGQPTARHWPEVLKKIQAAGKLIVIPVAPEDVAPLCELLEPEGVHMNCSVPTRGDADALVALAASIYKGKRNKKCFIANGGE